MPIEYPLVELDARASAAVFAAPPSPMPPSAVELEFSGMHVKLEAAANSARLHAALRVSWPWLGDHFRDLFNARAAVAAHDAASHLPILRRCADRRYHAAFLITADHLDASSPETLADLVIELLAEFQRSLSKLERDLDCRAQQAASRAWPSWSPSPRRQRQQ